jgi:carbon-monoxide dehydrogenase large subunit
VRWIEDRYEHMVAACHGRDMRIELEAAVERDGRIAAVRGNIVQDVGSGELFPGSYGPAFVAWGQLTGPYRIAHQQVDVSAVVTNKTPGGAYRGYGFPEAAFAMERLVDKIARLHDLSGVELRRRMIVQPDELPYTTPAGARLDSGSHREALDRCVELGLASRDRAREQADGDRHRIGVGFATYVEATGGSYHGTTGRWGAHDACDVRFDSDGSITAAVGTTTTGQGVRTLVATLVAEELGVPIERVRVVMGDTDATPHGLGGHSSRSTVVMAGAIACAGEALRAKGRAIAAHVLEAAPEDLELRGDGFCVVGDESVAVPWSQITALALGRTFELPAGMEPGLSARASYEPDTDSIADDSGRVNQGAAYTNATQAAVVSVELATGVVRVIQHVVVHDCGRVINPLVVRGQIEGGVAQGIAGALFEELPYDELGQPLATNFMTYLIPTAAEIPPMTLEEIESPSPVTARGVKGIGETGVIGAAPAIAAAVEDALAGLAIEEISSTPIRPADVLRAIDRTLVASTTSTEE